MPASEEEIKEALIEGVNIYPLASPISISGEENNLELTCLRMQLGEIDSNGRRRPESIKNSEFTLSFNTIISAIGQQPEVPSQFNLTIGPGNTVKVDPDTLATNVNGVYAGGDAVTGPASVIEAIAAGRQAAISIDKYLGGTGIIDEQLASPEGKIAPLGEAVEQRRPEMPVLNVKNRLAGFKQVELGYNDEKAVEEANRCLRCDLEELENPD
jgi:NADPH-dependent glutamate synthase beta subunit-like oxidoreductase